MPLVIKIFAGLSAFIHVMIFMMESVLWMNPKVHSRFLVQSVEDATVMQLLATNQGYYNLFLAIGIFVGFYMYSKNETVAKTLIGFICTYMVGASIVLIFTAPAMITGFIAQGLPPFVVIAYMFKNK